MREGRWGTYLVVDVYYDERTSCPAWLLVELDCARERLVLVPADGALSWSGSVVVPFERDAIVDAPTVAKPPPVLTGEPVCRLARHYGMRVNASAAYAAAHASRAA